MGLTAEPTVLPNFNPSGDVRVIHLKKHCQNLIEYVGSLDGDPRCKAIAATKLEEACMWAVKSLFVGGDTSASN